MKRTHTIPLIIFTVFFALAFAWILFHIGIYLPGRVVAEVIYADKDEFYGHDTLRYENENGEVVIFHHASDQMKLLASKGDKVLVAGNIVSNHDDANGQKNRKLLIVSIPQAVAMPVLDVVFALGILFCLWRYVKQKKALRSFEDKRTDADYRNNAQKLLSKRRKEENPFFEAESYDYSCTIFKDSSTARKKKLKLFQGHAEILFGEWMDSAKLHDLESIQKKKTEYTQTVFIPYENVTSVRYRNNNSVFIVKFYGKQFLTDTKDGQSYSDDFELNAGQMNLRELIQAIYKKTPLPDPDKFIDEINKLRHRSGDGLAKVEILKESFAYSDYGENEGFPTRYYINDVNVTELLEEDCNLTLPYGVYTFYVIAYTYRVRENLPDERAYKISNKLEVILNEEFADVSITIGRAIDSKESRHLSVKKK